MLRERLICQIIGFTLLWTTSECQVNSPVLASGKWTKFSVTKDGIYKIDYNMLKAAGFDADNLDPRKLSVYGNGAGMLPQPNIEPRNNQLTETAIYVSGESDGKFNTSDYLLFYAQGPDRYYFDTNKNLFSYQNHLYSDENFYFLTLSSGNGKRIQTRESIEGSHPVVNTFNDFIFHEADDYNELKSGREWYGEQFNSTTALTIKADVAGLLPGAVRIVSSVMAQSFLGSSFKVSLNGTSVTEQIVPSIPNTQYGIKGRVVTDTISTSQNSSSQLEFKYEYVKAPSGKSIGFLNFLIASFERKLALYGAQTQFQSAASVNNEVTTYDIESLTPTSQVWDVSDPFNPVLQAFITSPGKGFFSAPGNSLKTFIATKITDLPVPSMVSQIENQNISAINSQLIIMTPLDWKSEAERLAAHRQSFQGLTTSVLTTQQVYNEYSGGKQDPSAIRDFLKDIYSRFGRVQNLLLFGRCSYDYKNRVNKNTNFVPTYESRNSLSPLETYSSDDYFTFLESTEGEWRESPAQAHTMDIGVGRLPVSNIAEAKVVVDKLISYDINPKAFGPWRQGIAFVADDGDFNLHQSDADKLAENIEDNHFNFSTRKLYLDAFPQISKPSGQESPDARKALRKVTKQGALIINFTGHGSEKVWLQEQILDEDFVADWTNENEYPLLITATCEFGRHDDPAINSTSIQALTKAKGGTIGLVTASRPVSAFTNAALNKAFYDALFVKDDGLYRDLGTIFRDTKNNSVNGVSNRNFSLLADPSMKLAIPEREIIVNDLKTESGSDTLKALSKVVLRGEVQNNGTIDAGFSGILTATLIDKALTFTTLGDENAAFTYEDRTNILFRGQASVSEGIFELSFIVPKNIAYQIGTGKLSLYASNKNLQDASGGKTDFKIGGSEPSPTVDTSPPTIKLYMGDTTFINGSQVSSNTQLIAWFDDEGGINITNYGIGNKLVAILDGEFEFELSDYYVSGVDDFTKGMVTFPLEKLDPGMHHIEVRAWDNFNNPAKAFVDFVVTKEDGLVVETLTNYPNPFQQFTTLEFAHNRPGEDLEAQLEIFDRVGAKVLDEVYTVHESQARVTLGEWDGTNAFGAKLGNGIYVIRLTVRSLLDGSKNGRIAKVIIVN